MATTLASLVVKIGADTSDVTRGMADVEKQTRRVTGAFDAQSKSVTSAAQGAGKFNAVLTTLVREATGAHPAVARLTSIVSSLALGATMTTAVLAGVAAIGFAWRKLGEDARIAKEKAEGMTQLLDDLVAKQGPSPVQQAVVASGSRVAELEAQLRALNAEIASRQASGLPVNAKISERREVGADLFDEMQRLQAGVASLMPELDAIDVRVNRVAPSFGELSARSVELQINLDALKVGTVELGDVQEGWVEWMERGRDITDAMRTPLELYNDTLRELDALLQINAISQDTHARAVQQATVALNAQAAAASNDADAIGELAGSLGKIGSLFGILGLSFPGLGQAAGLLNLFAGGFATGGTIPAGQWGVVGERGPEVVSGPATVTPMGGSTPGITVNVPPARDPITFARDRQWLAALEESVEAMKHNGVRFA
ncbi:MAG: hypothetical protein ABL993_05270 [Vicinamibacterales bacterium]